MAQASEHHTQIEAAVSRARRRWLVSAVVNAGGRWAVLPAGVIALVGIALALAGVTSLVVLLPLVALGLVGAIVALALTGRAYAKPAAAGAPDWSLLLDRALGLNDALPAYLEERGGFSEALGGRIASALDAVREKSAAPRRNYASLLVALILALFPLVSWLPDPLAAHDEPPAVAEQPQNPTAADNPMGPGNATPSGTGDEGEEAGSGGEQPNPGGGGDEGKVQKRPDGAKTEGGAGDPPEDVKPEPSKDNPKPKDGGTGDNPNAPTEAPKPEDKDVETDLTKIKPDAGEGETRIEDRSRWVYNPDGDKTGATPRPRDARYGNERAMPRTKLTTSERKLIESVYKKLYE